MALPKIALQYGKTHVADLLKETFGDNGYDTLGIAVAYATVPGVRKMLDSILQGNVPKKSFWLFGLDDWITHPDAIELAMQLKGATVKVATGGGKGGKFHPKMYWFSGKGKRSSMVLGSANLTRNGLSENVEAVAALVASGKSESATLDAIWVNAWKLGKSPTRKVLADYRAKFVWAREARKKAGLNAEKKPPGSTKKSGKQVVLENDAASVDPSLASTCWIEVGNITGFGADQLEIKAEQALFFGLESEGGPDEYVRLKLDSGATVSIRVQYFRNHMWRFWLSQDIPEVAGKGLRPGGRRSPYAAVFRRTRSTYSLRFVKLGTVEFKKLRKETEHAGTLGRTTAREYGWV